MLMFTLFFAILAGIVLAFFAVQNTASTTIVVAGTPLNNIPLWLVIIASLFIGLITAFYFNVINIISSALKLRGKDSAIKGADSEIKDLKNEIQKLKAENANLASKKDSS